MADVPSNQRLWNMLIVQAKAKYGKWPSLPASRWVHQQYLEKGGRFISENQAARMKKAAPAKKKPARGKEAKGRK